MLNRPFADQPFTGSWHHDRSVGCKQLGVKRVTKLALWWNKPVDFTLTDVIRSCRSVPVDTADETGGSHAELPLCEPAVYGADSATGSIPTTPPPISTSQPHPRLSTHRQVSHSGGW